MRSSAALLSHSANMTFFGILRGGRIGKGRRGHATSLLPPVQILAVPLTIIVSHAPNLLLLTLGFVVDSIIKSSFSYWVCRIAVQVGVANCRRKLILLSISQSISHGSFGPQTYTVTTITSKSWCIGLYPYLENHRLRVCYAHHLPIFTQRGSLCSHAVDLQRRRIPQGLSFHFQE